MSYAVSRPARSRSIRLGHLVDGQPERPGAHVVAPQREHDQPGLVVPGDPQRAVATAGVEEDLPGRGQRTRGGHDPVSPRAGDLSPVPARDRCPPTGHTGPRARAARGGSAGPRPEGPARRPCHRQGPRRGVQRAEDLRPAGPGARGHAGRRRHPARQVPRHRGLRAAPGPPPRPRRLDPLARRGARGAAAPEQQVPARGARRPRRRQRASTSPRPAPRRASRCTSSGHRTTYPASPASGPDPLDDAFTRDVLGRDPEDAGRSQIKGVLRHQGTIAGIGNAYSDEILHAARMSPFKPANSLTADELRPAVRRDPDVLGDAVDALARPGRQRAQGREEDQPRGARPRRRDLPGLRRHRPRGQLRRLEPAVLPDLPDRRQAPGRPADVASAEVEAWTLDSSGTDPDRHRRRRPRPAPEGWSSSTCASTTSGRPATSRARCTSR